MGVLAVPVTMPTNAWEDFGFWINPQKVERGMKVVDLRPFWFSVIGHRLWEYSPFQVSDRLLSNAKTGRMPIPQESFRKTDCEIRCVAAYYFLTHRLSKKLLFLFLSALICVYLSSICGKNLTNDENRQFDDITHVLTMQPDKIWSIIRTGINGRSIP